MNELGDQLSKTPDLGEGLGGNVYKIRLAVKSKGKGKRDGAKVIILCEDCSW